MKTVFDCTPCRRGAVLLAMAEQVFRQHMGAALLRLYGRLVHLVLGVLEAENSVPGPGVGRHGL